jgi:prolyl-tRNA synthetase
MILGLYREFMERWIAMPVVTGAKTDSEKFAGAVRSYSCEALMQDNRALQAGTSHFLGQNFAKQFELKFQSVEGKEEYAWNTSWGVSTRMVGGMVMTHGDDEGIVVPPRLAPVQVVVVPIVKAGDPKAEAIRHKADELAGMLTAQHVRVKVDHRDHLSPGAKFYEWERKGVPFRMELGPKDLDKEQVVLVRRVAPEEGQKKEFLPQAHAVSMLPERLEVFQRELLARAMRRREENSHRGVNDWGEMKEILESKGGFVYTGWSGDPAVEARAKEELKATIRVIPDREFRSATAPTRCIGGGGASRMEVVWARAY